MTFLSLVNNVLRRLREVELDETAPDFAQKWESPYIRSIKAHVNDAKDRVEDAWQWGALRDRETTIVSEDDIVVSITNSADNHTLLKDISIREKGRFLGYVNTTFMKQRYATGGGPVPKGVPTYYGFAQDTPTGDKQITIYPSSDATYTFDIDLVRHQDPLVNTGEVLKVPSLPVYTLATALASRERGEVGGTPTSELFAIADRHLSDAIANDSARFPDELDWFANDRWFATNHRTA